MINQCSDHTLLKYVMTLHLCHVSLRSIQRPVLVSISLKSFKSFKRWAKNCYKVFFELNDVKGTLGNLRYTLLQETWIRP